MERLVREAILAMKCWIAVGILLLSGCSSAPTLESSEPLDRCESTSCFNQLQIRDFEIVDPSTLIVYVGAQECPFLVEFTGTFCDLTFLPGFDLVFRPSTQRQNREVVLGGGFGDRADISNARICANDFNMGIEEGGFSESGGSEDNLDGLDCRIQDVSSLTDDEILEVYVDNNITLPPPPFGTGEIEVSEAGDESAETTAANPDQPEDGDSD